MGSRPLKMATTMNRISVIPVSMEAGRLGLVGAEEEEEEEEEEDLFVFNDSIEGPRAPTVKPGRRERVCCLLVLNSVTFAPQ